jgi:hypothetical protein
MIGHSWQIRVNKHRKKRASGKNTGKIFHVAYDRLSKVLSKMGK